MVHCLKCGRETEENQSFCSDCLLDMRKHPVDPNAVVLLPRRETTAPVKKSPRKKTLTPEERILSLKRRSRLLMVLLVLAVLACGILIYPTAQYLRRSPVRRGQNYSSLIPVESVSATVGRLPQDTAK